jgi:hypothetical protein
MEKSWLSACDGDITLDDLIISRVKSLFLLVFGFYGIFPWDLMVFLCG